MRIQFQARLKESVHRKRAIKQVNELRTCPYLNQVGTPNFSRGHKGTCGEHEFVRIHQLKLHEKLTWHKMQPTGTQQQKE